MQLTQNFSLAEFLHSDTANSRRIKNEANAVEIGRMKVVAENLQKLRALLGAPIVITSGFRSEALNKAVGGVDNSDHRLGWAVDLKAPSFGNVMQTAQAIARTGIKFDQLIYEQDGGTEWVHLSFNPRMRQQVISWKRGKGYVNGIVKL